MKNLKLSANNFNKGEVLTRAQLKKIMGGVASGPENTWLCSCGGTNTDQSVYGETNTEAMRNFDSSNCNPGDIAICTPYV